MTDRWAEKPAVHNTWVDYDNYGIFEYSTYGPGSVLEGQEKRSCLGSYATLAEAQIDFPGVRDAGGSGFTDHPIPENPPEWFREDDIGER